MKKITLLVASIFLIGSGVANATERNDRKSPVDFRNAEPIVFVERGIEFYLFADGQFDFNTQPSSSEMYYRSGRRTSAVNKTYGAPVNTKNRNYGVVIEHDKNGKVRRVGNVMINYDSNNRVKRVGSVYMTYNRYALTQVGGLKIVYNYRNQIVDRVGSVNGGNSNSYNNNGYENDKEEVYYRTNSSKPKIVGSVAVRINI